MRNAFIIPLIISLFSLSQLKAQPAIDFIGNYNFNNLYPHNGDASFEAVCAGSDSGFTMVGTFLNQRDYDYSIVFKVNKFGEELWKDSWDPSTVAYSVTETDDGVFFIGYDYDGSNHFRALTVTDSRYGQSFHFNYFGAGRCRAVIELKNGNLLFGGNDTENGKLVLTDNSGEQIWSRNYNQDESVIIHDLIETHDGVICVGGGGDHTQFLAMKIAIEEGEIIWSHLYDFGDSLVSYDVELSGDGGFVLCGGDSNFILLKIDDVGEELFRRIYRNVEGPEMCRGVTRNHDGEFVLVGQAINNEDIMKAQALRVTSQGDIRWRQTFDLE